MATTHLLIIVLVLYTYQVYGQFDANAVIVSAESPEKGFDIRLLEDTTIILQSCRDDIYDVDGALSMAYLPSENLLFITEAVVTGNKPNFFVVDPVTCEIKRSCFLLETIQNLGVDRRTGILYGVGALGFSTITINYTTCDLEFKHFCQEPQRSIGAGGISIIGRTAIRAGRDTIQILPEFRRANCTPNITIEEVNRRNIFRDIAPISKDQVILRGAQRKIILNTTSLDVTNFNGPLPGNGLASIFHRNIPTLVTAKGRDIGFDYRFASKPDNIIGSCDNPELGGFANALAYHEGLDRVLYVSSELPNRVYLVNPYNCKIKKTCFGGGTIFGIAVDQETGKVYIDVAGDLTLEMDLDKCSFKSHCTDQTELAGGITILNGVMYAGRTILKEAAGFRDGSCAQTRALTDIGSCRIRGLTAISNNTLIASCAELRLLKIDIPTFTFEVIESSEIQTDGLTSFGLDTSRLQ